MDNKKFIATISVTAYAAIVAAVVLFVVYTTGRHWFTLDFMLCIPSIILEGIALLLAMIGFFTNSRGTVIASAIVSIVAAAAFIVFAPIFIPQIIAGFKEAADVKKSREEAAKAELLEMLKNSAKTE